ncbi:MAG: amidohydrolase family protein [Caulobacterales bacterium]
MPAGIGVVDTMIGFPAEDFKMYDFIREQLKDPSAKFDFPVEYMFKQVPKELYGSGDPISITLHEMDRFGVEMGLIGVGGDVSRQALKAHPDRFIPQGSVDPNKGMDGIRDMVRQYETFGVRSFGAFNAGYYPQVGISDALMYPIYAKCVELGVPIFSCAGVPGPRMPMWPQEVRLIDQVMYDFPELVFVTRHGCEPWEDLAVKLMLKWPNLYYSTSAFAPKHYPEAIVRFANTRGADKIIYAGYFPMGLTLERIMGDMAAVPFRDEVWPKFLRENAMKVLKLA